MGDGPERSTIEILCRELNLGNSISFLGKQNPVEEILSICDLFLLPSETESFGLAALEAMACEVPVVSSNAGGIPELNVDGVTGFLCNVGDVCAMAEKSIYILEDNDRLAQFKKPRWQGLRNLILIISFPNMRISIYKFYKQKLNKRYKMNPLQTRIGILGAVN